MPSFLTVLSISVWIPFFDLDDNDLPQTAPKSGNRLIKRNLGVSPDILLRNIIPIFSNLV